MRQGQPLLHDIMMCYTDLTALMKKMPDGKSINEGLWLMHRHLGAASAVAEHTNFATGESNTLFAVEHPPPPLMLLSAASLRKCKSSLKDANRKKQKVDSGIADEPAANLPLLSLDEHLATMDVAGELRGDDLLEPEEVVQKDVQKVQEEEDEEIDSTDLGENQCICGLDFDSWEKLVEHRSNHPKNSFVCSWKYKVGELLEPCGEEFKNSNSMWRHYRSVHLGKFYYCAVKGCTCGKLGGKYGSDNSDQVKKHMNDVHKIDSDLQCPKCPYIAGAKFRLCEHIDRCQVNKRVKLYICGTCGKGFREKACLATHERQDHPSDPDDTSAFYFCNYCEKKFKMISGRRKHAVKHTLKQK